MSNKTIKTKIFGLDVIVRHDYEGIRLKKIRSYIEKSVDFVMKYLDNYPYGLKTLLDIGASDDYAIKQFGGYGLECEGIDLYPTSPKIKKLDFYELEKLGKKYDIVFVNHTIEHADSPYRLMEQISKVINQNGILFIACPNGRTDWAWSLFHSTTHFSCIVPEFLDTMVKRFGFETIMTLKEFREGASEIFLIGRKI